MSSIDAYEDLIDVRDIIDAYIDIREDADERDEAEFLAAFLGELAGNGGDHQWEGQWYPVTMIRDSYFKDYAQELAEDIGAINPDASWPNDCIDWDRAARELQMDYTSVEYRGITYWYR